MKTRLQLILLLFLYSLLSYQFIKNHLYDVNPDGISYIEIAQIYKSGNLREAINAYWGPGYSLALLLLSYFFGWIQTARALTFGLNILWIVGLYVLSLKLLKSEVKAFSVVGLSFLFPTFFDFWRLITPDFLLTAYSLFLLLFFYYIIQSENQSKKKWLVLGFLAGVGYLIKPFFLLFAIVFFPLVFLRIFGRKFLKPTIYLFLGLFLIVAGWTLLIYWKYGKITTGTSGTVIYKNTVLKQEYEFLYKPVMYPRKGTSYWVDPSDFTLATFDFRKQMIALQINLWETLIFFIKRFHFGIFILLLGLNRLRRNKQLLILLIFSTLWVAIYSTIYVEERYLWPIITPILIMIIGSSKSSHKYLLGLYYIFALVLFAKYYIQYLPPDPNSRLHVMISEKIHSPCVILSDKWERGLYISFFSGCKYYGVSETSTNIRDIDKTLQRETKDGTVTHFIAFDGKKYQRLPDFSLEQEWIFNNFDVLLYRTKTK